MELTPACPLLKNEHISTKSSFSIVIEHFSMADCIK